MKTKKITTLGMLCAIAYIMTFLARIPVVLFLKYDPKDIIITLGGLIFGPMAAFTISVIVSVLELFTISDTGIWGCIMNIISSCSFAVVASLIYKKHRNIRGAVAGLFAGFVSMCVCMMLWNYLITPIYMGIPREEVVKLLLPAFLPFNIIKGGLNAAFTFLLYKPLITALRRAGLIPSSTQPDANRISNKPLILWVGSALIIIICILMIIRFNS